jgi:NAD(P)-dependent dehydrogenase (short-subunit alcohol dehydrogenase family)
VAGQDYDVRGKVAVVTGATRGIGRQVAFTLGRAGATVVAVGRTSDANPNAVLPGTVDEVAAALAAEGIEARGVQADLVDPEATGRLIDEVLGAYGRCDVLVNNAAYTTNAPLMEIPWRRWQSAFRVQVVAPQQLVQGFVPGMLSRGSGRVVNIGSSAANGMTKGLALYGVSKRAMEHWNDYLELELGGGGVTFNTLRVERVVITEGWQYVYDTKGADVATGGRGMGAAMTSEEASEHVAWMVRQPDSWSGHTVGFDDIAALGGPPCPEG